LKFSAALFFRYYSIFYCYLERLPTDRQALDGKRRVLRLMVAILLKKYLKQPDEKIGLFQYLNLDIMKIWGI